MRFQGSNQMVTCTRPEIKITGAELGVRSKERAIASIINCQLKTKILPSCKLEPLTPLAIVQFYPQELLVIFTFN